MMKILILSPFINAAHEITVSLQKKGMAVLCPADSKEAWQMVQVHGASLDLMIVHREDARGQGQPGLELIQNVKNHPVLQNVPYILSTVGWNDTQCVQHQGTPQGANAYLHWPFDSNAVLALVSEIVGATVASASPSSGYALESSDVIFAQPQLDRKQTMSIVLEAPDLAGNASGSDFEKPEEDAATKVLQDMLMPSLDEPVSAESVVAASTTPPSIPIASEPVIETAEAAAAVSSAPADAGGEGIAINLDAMAEVENAQIETSQHPVEISTTPEPALSEPIALSTEIPLSASEPLNLDSVVEAAPVPTATGASSAFDPSLLKVEDPAAPTSIEPSTDQSQQSIPSIQSVSGKTGQTAAATASDPIDPQAAAEMPYIYSSPDQSNGLPLEAGFPVSVDDAVVPGGAAQAPDVETVKKYLLLRENDVSSLSSQLRAAREQIRNLEDLVRLEKARATELSHMAVEQKKKNDDFEKQKQSDQESFQREVEELKFQLKTKTDKSKVMERQVQDAIEDLEKVKERVRIDIRKIRIREKELENRLEIMKRDSEVLLSSREGKIIELKRKVDLLEFNMDLLQDQLSKEKDRTAQLRDKLTRASQAIRLAGGLLDSSGNVVFDIQQSSGAEPTITASIPSGNNDPSNVATVVMDPTEVTKRAS